jgi:predicted O-methyltransferase YrrM
MRIIDLLNAVDESIKCSLHGWCTIDKARTLALLVTALKPAVTVEIGVYTGKSAIAMALAHKFVEQGHVLCIDPWSVEASVEGYDQANKEWWASVDHEEIYKEFINRIIQFGVTAQIEIVRNKSDYVEPPIRIDLFHCDGQHTDQAIRDVERFASRVVPGGITVMDDIEWGNGEVKEAARKLIAMGFIELFRLGTGAVYQRV